MNKQFYFISGLPRSGTTLLSVILNQNPRFHASISGPLARYTRAIIDRTSDMSGYRTHCPPEKRRNIIKGIFDNYYDDPDKEVFFDTNRGWGLLTPVIRDMYPYTKIIMCVRDIAWILDSFENLFRKNPYDKNAMIPEEWAISVYSRCDYLMRADATLGFAFMSLKEAITSRDKDMIMVVEYEQLCKNPKGMMKAIYNFIDQPYYDHDFNNVAASHVEFDNEVNIKGLHTTRKEIQYIPRTCIIPPDIIEKYSNMEVWRYVL